MIRVKVNSHAHVIERGRFFLRSILPTPVKHFIRRVLLTDHSEQANARSPTESTARGVNEQVWLKSQIDMELNFWVNQYPKEVPEGKGLKEHYHEHYWSLNRSMFKTITAAEGKLVVDVGCGPFGSLDLRSARLWIGIDSLARSYQSHYGFDANFVAIDAPAECIPLLDEVADIVVCINALDHFREPYRALEEMYRLCQPGGHFLLATDVGGTPDHPCNINPRHLDEFIVVSGFDIIEKDCGTHLPSSWGAEAQIPLYVFHGIKNLKRRSG